MMTYKPKCGPLHFLPRTQYVLIYFRAACVFLHIVYFFINVSDKVNKSAAWTLTSNLLMNQDRHDVIYALTR